MQVTLEKLARLVPDLEGLVPESLKPYAKFVVVVALGLIYLLVSLTVLDDSTGREWAGIVLFVAGALGVVGTSNADEDTDPPPDDALVSDGGDPVDPSGELGFEPDDEAGEIVEPLPAEDLPPEAVPEQPPIEDESVKGPGEQRRDPETPPPEPPAESGR